LKLNPIDADLTFTGSHSCCPKIRVLLPGVQKSWSTQR